MLGSPWRRKNAVRRTCGAPRAALLASASYIVLALGISDSGAQTPAACPLSTPNGLGQIAVNGCQASPAAGPYATSADNTPAFAASGDGLITPAGAVSIQTTGAAANGAIAESGGDIVFAAGTAINVQGANGIGLYANDPGSTIESATINVSAANTGSSGVFADDHSVITLNGGAVQSAAAALHTENGGAINATNVDITATSPGALGVNANVGVITLTGGSVRSLGSAASHGLSASNTGSQITAANLTVEAAGDGARALNGGVVALQTTTILLSTANAVGARAQAGGAVSVVDTLIDTTSVGAAATGQTGLVSTQSGSTLTGTNSTIDMRTASGTANNMTGAIAQAGGGMTLNNVAIFMGGGANAIGNRGVIATGAGSMIGVTGGSVTIANSRNAIGVLAQDQGAITLNGVTINNAGVQTTGTPALGSQAMLASGAGSSITGTNVTANATGALGNAARAELGGAITLTGGTLTTGAAGTDPEPAAVARATSGGQLNFTGTTLTGANANFAHGLAVDGAGSFARMTNADINAVGLRSAGVSMRGGSAEISGSTISSGQSVGVDASLATTLTLMDTNIDTLINTGHGLRALTGANVTITRGSITTNGADATGMFASASTVNANNLVIVTNGNDNAIGVLADLQSAVTLNGGSVTTHGNNVRAASYPHALTARNPGGVLTATDTILATTGNVAIGAVADDGGVVNLLNNNITTQGERSLGLFVVTEQTGAQFIASLTGDGLTIETFGLRGHGATAQSRNDILTPLAGVTLSGSAITTHGDSAQGLRAVLADYGARPTTGRGEAALTASDTRVETFGADAYGAFSRDNPTSVTMARTDILTHGALAHGAVASLGGRIDGTNTSVSAEGAGASALFVLGEDIVSNAAFTDSTLTNRSGAVIAVGGMGDIALTGVTVSGSSQWLFVGAVTELSPLANPGPALTGVGDLPPDAPDPPPPELPAPSAPQAEPIATPGLANIVMTNSTATGSALTAPGSVSNLTMQSGSIWTLTGDSNITNLLNDNSAILFAAPTGDPTSIDSYLTLTTVNYTGVAGAMTLNTYLGDDASPSDILVINGGLGSGDTTLTIAPTAGAGALTTGDGILVVDDITGNTTTPSAFQLGNDVIAGPYQYLLYRGGADADAQSDWFLRSTIDCNAAGAPTPPCPEPPPVPPEPPVPPTPAPIPNYRGEVSLYAAVPALMQLYGRALIGTLHNRVGEEEHLRRSRSLDDDEDIDGAWVRVIGLNGEHEGDGRGIYGAGPAFDFDLAALQAGIELHRDVEDDGDRDHAGITFSIGHAEADATHFDGRPVGRDRLDIYSLGGYWTRFDEDGAYLDAVAHVSWYDISAESVRLPALKGDAWGVALSLEIGKPFDLEDQEVIERGWIIEPQAQLAYQHFNGEDANDIAARVSFDDTDSLIGRLGVRIANTLAQDSEHGELDTTLWGRFNVWHEFLDPPEISFSSENGAVPFHADIGDTWLELNGGMTAQLDEAATLYLDASYIWDTEDQGHAVAGRLGVRWNW